MNLAEDTPAFDPAALPPGEAEMYRWVMALQGESTRGTILLATSLLEAQLEGPNMANKSTAPTSVGNREAELEKALSDLLPLFNEIDAGDHADHPAFAAVRRLVPR